MPLQIPQSEAVQPCFHGCRGRASFFFNLYFALLLRESGLLCNLSPRSSLLTDGEKIQ